MTAEDNPQYSLKTSSNSFRLLLLYM